MVTWYLIIILSGSNGVSQQTVEFKNETACISVMETLAEKYDNQRSLIICVKDE